MLAVLNIALRRRYGGLDETPTEHLLFSYENISYKIVHEEDA